jgi:hypothetical protein
MLKLSPFEAGAVQCSWITHPSCSLVMMLVAGGRFGGAPFGRTSQTPSQKSNSRYRAS